MRNSSQNHDNQPNISHSMEIQREILVAPYSYTRLAPEGVGGEGGQGNYWVPVRSTLQFHRLLSSNPVCFLFPISCHRCIDRYQTTNRFSSFGSSTPEAESPSETRRPHILLTTGSMSPLRIGLRKKVPFWSSTGARPVHEVHLLLCISLRK